MITNRSLYYRLMICTLMVIVVALIPLMGGAETFLINGIDIIDGATDVGAGFLASGKTDYFSGRTHLGIDIMAPIGSVVYAIADGYVVDASMHNGYGGNGNSKGGAILIRHTNMNGDDFYAIYGHLSYLVSTGEWVKQGDPIASVAAWDYGSHLHLGISTIYQSNPYAGFLSYETSTAPTGWVNPINYINNYLNVSNSPQYGSNSSEKLPTIEDILRYLLEIKKEDAVAYLDSHYLGGELFLSDESIGSKPSNMVAYSCPALNIQLILYHPSGEGTRVTKIDCGDTVQIAGVNKNMKFSEIRSILGEPDSLEESWDMYTDLDSISAKYTVDGLLLVFKFISLSEPPYSFSIVSAKQ